MICCTLPIALNYTDYFNIDNMNENLCVSNAFRVNLSGSLYFASTSERQTK
jgi:hypothetical protein